jgi:hypothetical protein
MILISTKTALPENKLSPEELDRSLLVVVNTMDGVEYYQIATRYHALTDQGKKWMWANPIGFIPENAVLYWATLPDLSEV